MYLIGKKHCQLSIKKKLQNVITIGQFKNQIVFTRAKDKHHSLV